MIFQLGEFIFNAEFTPESIEHAKNYALQIQNKASGGQSIKKIGILEQTISLEFQLVRLDNYTVLEQFERLQEIADDNDPFLYIDNDNNFLGYFVCETFNHTPSNFLGSKPQSINVTMTLRRSQ